MLLVADGAVAALHGGWRGLADGVVEPRASRALREVGGERPVTAAIGPAARGCCYEVGDEVRAAFAGYDARVGGREPIDLKAIARAAAEAAGVEAVHDVGLCTMCATRAVLLAPPRRRRHRPPGGGGVAGLITGLTRPRAPGVERVRGEIAEAARRAGRDPDDVEILAAVKYLAVEELGVLQEAGLTLLGENRAQELEEKAEA